MRFVKLPNDVKHVTCMVFNTQKTLLAVGVRNQDLEGYEQLNCTVYVYSVGSVGGQGKQSVKGLKGIGGFEVKREKQFTIKATNGIPLNYAKCPPQRKNSNGGTPLNATGGSSTMNVFYDRYISDMTFSRDDKNLAICIRNGDSECYVQTYDF